MKKRNVISWVLLVVLSVITITLEAQEKRLLSLNDCIKIALKNNSQLRNGKRDVQLAKTDITIVRSNILPDISSTFYSARYIQGERKRRGDVPVGIDSVTGAIIYEQRDYIQSKIERNSHYASIQLNQNIWDWGRSWLSLKQASLGKKAAEFSLISLRHNVIYNVKQRYFELLKATKLGEVYQEAVKRSEEQLKRIEIMHQIGSVALADVYKARVSLGNDQINLITQKNLIIEAKANLNNALGLDPDSPIEIEEKKETLLSIKYVLENALKIALEKNPELKNFELNIQNYKYEKHKAKLAFLPTLYGSLRYSRDNEYFDRVYNKRLDRDYSVSFGAQVNLNIFKGFADKAELDRQSLNYAKAQEDYYERKRILKAQVTQAFLSLKAYKEISEINDTNLESAEEDLRLAQESYKIGAGTLLEVIDAQLAVTQARSTLVSAKYNTQIALAYLESLMGVLEE